MENAEVTYINEERIYCLRLDYDASRYSEGAIRRNYFADAGREKVISEIPD